MTDMLRQLQESAGFISIETIIVVGLMIALGVFAIQKFFDIGQEQTDHAMTNINQVLLTATSTP